MGEAQGSPLRELEAMDPKSILAEVMGWEVNFPTHQNNDERWLHNRGQGKYTWI